MKTFIYTIKEHKPPRDGSGIVKTITIHQIVRGNPRLVLRDDYTFMSEFQAVLEHMQKLKPNPLPRRAYELNQFGGFKYGHAYTMREAKIANFIQV